MKPRSKDFYDKWGNTINQHLSNYFTNITVKKVGSRANGTFGRDSDLDYQFCLEGGETTREDFYPKLKDYLQGKLLEKYMEGETVTDVKIGESGNVVNVLFQKGGKISFALMSCDEL